MYISIPSVSMFTYHPVCKVLNRHSQYSLSPIRCLLVNLLIEPWIQVSLIYSQ